MPGALAIVGSRDVSEPPIGYARDVHALVLGRVWTRARGECQPRDSRARAASTNERARPTASSAWVSVKTSAGMPPGSPLGYRVGM